MHALTGQKPILFIILVNQWNTETFIKAVVCFCYRFTGIITHLEIMLAEHLKSF